MNINNWEIVPGDLLLAWGYTMEVSWPKDCVMVYKEKSD